MIKKQQLEQEKKEEVYDRKRREQEEREETKKEEKSNTERAKETQKPIEIIIPIVKLEKPQEEMKKIEIDKNISEIKKETQKITIPIIELEKANVELKDVKFISTLPKIQIKVDKLELPLIKLDRLREIGCLITTFDDKLPQISPIPSPILRVPIYRLSKNVIREAISSFDSRVDTQIPQLLIEEVLAKRQKTDTASTESEPFGGENGSEEIPDIVDFVFGVSNSKISSKGPKIVLYKELENDSTIGGFETLCMRIYREKHGGEPKFRPRKKLDEFNIREIERWDEAGRKIITIDLDNDKKEEVYAWFREEKLREPVGRTITGDVGFIIFKTRDANLYEYCKKIMENLEDEIEHPLDVAYVEPKSLSFDVKKELSSLAWGNLKLDEANEFAVKLPKFERFIGTGVFDDIFNKLSKKSFENRLESLKGSAYHNATKPHEGESIEHKEIKWFVVKYLTKRLTREGVLKPKNPKEPKAFEINGTIRTEEDNKEELGGKVADVLDTFNKEAYEIETLFAEDGEGKTAEEKLNYTIDKYKELRNIRKINIVFDNLTLLRYLRVLRNVKENKPKEEKERVEFYTLDTQNDKLIPSEEVIKNMTQLFKSSTV